MKKTIFSLFLAVIATGTFLAESSAHQTESQALFEAVEFGKYNTVKKLLSHGVNVNALMIKVKQL